VINKVQPTLTFVDGSVSIRRSGYGRENGSGWFTFDETDVEFIPNDDRAGCHIVVKLPRSEMEGIRDWLNRELAAVVNDEGAA
jgi:hypothetical protein